MGALTQLTDQLSALLVEARALSLPNLFFAEESTARLAGVVLAGLALLVLHPADVDAGAPADVDAWRCRRSSTGSSRGARRSSVTARC